MIYDDENEDLFEGFDTPNHNSEEFIDYENDIDEDVFSDNVESVDKPDGFMAKLLEFRGLKDGKIKIIEEDGSESEWEFSKLTDEEKIQLLTGETGRELYSDDEMSLIKTIRDSKMSPSEYLNKQREEALEALSKEQIVNYDIDNYDDEELFILDLQAKYELSEEELVQELETALKNKPLFDKKVSKLREEYKVLEDQYKESIRTEEYNKFVNTVNTAANNLSEFHGIVLEDSDKAEAIKYLTELDSEGLSAFSRDLRDPKKIFEVAWYLRWGKDAFKAIENAYENEINKLKKR